MEDKFDFNKLMENPDPTKIPRKWQCAEELEKWYKKVKGGKQMSCNLNQEIERISKQTAQIREAGKEINRAFKALDNED